MRKKRQTFSKEFKLEAVRLLERSDPEYSVQSKINHGRWQLNLDQTTLLE